jgi:hypothetical protein
MLVEIMYYVSPTNVLQVVASQTIAGGQNRTADTGIFRPNFLNSKMLRLLAAESIPIFQSKLSGYWLCYLFRLPGQKMPTI